MLKVILEWLEFAVIALSAIAVIYCFFVPNAFLAHADLRLLIFIGGGFMPIKHLFLCIKNKFPKQA